MFARALLFASLAAAAPAELPVTVVPPMSASASLITTTSILQTGTGPSLPVSAALPASSPSVLVTSASSLSTTPIILTSSSMPSFPVSPTPTLNSPLNPVNSTSLLASPPIPSLSSASAPSSHAAVSSSTSASPSAVPTSSSASPASSQPTSATGASSPTSAPIPLQPLTSALPPTPESVSVATVTDVITITQTQSVEVHQVTTTTVEQVTATITKTVTPTPDWATRTLWAQPTAISDLDMYNVSSFPNGQDNLALVNVTRFSALHNSTSDSSSNSSASVSSLAAHSNHTTALRVLYVAGSSNPGGSPEGGVQFYASPLNLDGAWNVSLRYGVFFPKSFDWIKGGKLPGLYGGHESCSGGASAKDCFSTRLMWRDDGAGELYLYAPKDKQTAALCGDPQSVCDADYGLSIGRGSFKFTAGGWTDLRQDIVLNTPGEQDGAFVLYVDGKAVINRMDVFYRDHPSVAGDKSQRRRRGDVILETATFLEVQTVAQAKSTETVGAATTTVGVYPTALPKVHATSGESSKPVGFIGLFFSTFFGGHGSSYATPKDQYAWFRDFAIVRNE